MKEPKLSDDGNCPTCSGIDWKLARVLVLDGVTNIDTESNGGGFGIGVGSAGVNVNYQGLDLSTTGTHTSATAQEYAPPIPPNQYDRKDYWVKECSNVLKQAADKIVKVDQFAVTSERITPGFFSNSITDGDIESCEKKYKECSNHLIEFRAYESEKALWDRTRVCMRCGDSFVTDKDIKSTAASFDVPEFLFEGKGRRCPNCNSYQWKTADAFFSIKIRQLEGELKSGMDIFQWTLDKSKKLNNGGLLSQPILRLLAVKPEDAKKIVEQTQAELTAMNEAREQAIKHHQDLKGIRVCSSCETSYILEDEVPRAIVQAEQMDLSEKLAAHRGEAAIHVEKAIEVEIEHAAELQGELSNEAVKADKDERFLESSIPQQPAIPTTRHLSFLAATNYIDKIKKTRKEWLITLAVIFVVEALLLVLLSKSGLVQMHLGPATWVIFPVIFALVLWLFCRFVTHGNSWSATDLVFSENSLRISYPHLTVNLELIIPWSAIGNIGHASNDIFGEVFVIFIRDVDIANQLRANIKRNFGSNFWIGTPWVGSYSDAWWVRIFSKSSPALRILINSPPAAIDLLNIINAWRDSFALRESTQTT